MKIRTGFVSNSSTSSFICQVCENSWQGMDGSSYEDIGFTECKNGHAWCPDCYNNRYKDECPLCSLEIIEQWSVISYLLKTCGKTNEEIKSEIRNRFKTYNEMADFLGEKRRQMLKIDHDDY